MKQYSNNFVDMTDILSLCRSWQFDYQNYKQEVLRIGDVCAIRKAKNGRLFRRDYERAILLLAVASKYQSQRVLEFGTGRGFVSACLSMLEHVSHIATIDKLRQEKTRKLVESVAARGLDKIQFVSTNTFKLSHSAIKNDFDLVFIDGEHTEKAVKNDFKFAMKHTADDAIIVFDDYRNKHKGVKKYIKSLKYDKVLVYTDGWIYENIMINKHGDADVVKDQKEYKSGQVILYKNGQK